jgi:Na+-driven multidrug efflux pump
MDHLVMYGVLMAALSIFLLIIKRIYCHRVYEECHLHVGEYYDNPLLKEMGGFAGWSLLGSSSSMIGNYSVALIFNFFFGTFINAANAIAGQLTGQLSVFANTLIKALNPNIDKSEGAGNRQLMLKTTMIGCKISFFMLAFFFIPAIIEMSFILKLWIINIPDFTLIFCILALIRNQIDQIFMPLQSAIGAVGKIKSFQIISSLINSAPMLISCALFYLKFPPYYLFLVLICNSFISGFITIYFAKIICNLSIIDFLKNVLIRVLVSFFLIFVLSYLSSFYLNDSNLKLIVTLLTSSISFFFIVWIFGFNNDEKKKLMMLFKKIQEKVQIKYSY